MNLGLPTNRDFLKIGSIKFLNIGEADVPKAQSKHLPPVHDVKTENTSAGIAKKRQTAVYKHAQKVRERSRHQ